MVGVIEEVRSQRLEPQPVRRRLLARLEDEPDPAHFAPALDPPGHLVVRKIALQPLLQPIGVAGIETLSDQRLQVVSKRLRQLGVGHARDVGVLDDIARVDVLVVAGLALTADDEEHARLAVGIHDGAHRGDVARPLFLDACRQFVEPFLFELRAGEVPDVLLKAGTQAIEIEPGHLRRGDDGAVGHRDALIRRRLRRGGQQRDEQAKCAHARAESKE